MKMNKLAVTAEGFLPSATALSTLRRMGSKIRQRRWVVIAALACSLAAAGTVGAAIDREALWMVVNELCVADENSNHDPAPCTKVNLAEGRDAGWAILKDPTANTQFLLVPTRRLTGIEAPLIGTSELPNYWRAAWSAEGLVSESAHKELPRNAIGMAINAANARTQDQLHIHIDCIRPDVREALSNQATKITTRWANFDFGGHTYRARRIDGTEPEPDPFALLADDARERNEPMGDETLAVIAAQLDDENEGFILLSDHSATPGRAHAEDLLDHTCALAAR